MSRHKPKTFLRIFFHEQFISLVYFVSVFLIYSILFELASLSLLIETLRYLWPLIVLGGVLVFVNLLRTWRIYKNSRR